MSKVNTLKRNPMDKRLLDGQRRYKEKAENATRCVRERKTKKDRETERQAVASKPRREREREKSEMYIHVEV